MNFEIIPTRRWIAALNNKDDNNNNASDQLTVGQFNILAKQLEDAFDVEPEIKCWEHRHPLLLQQIEHINPDIMGFEEVDVFDQFLQPELAKRGYEGLHYLQENYHMGNALFFKPEKAKLLDKKFVDFRRRPQTAILARFRTTSGSPTEFVAAVTHLKAKPGLQNTHDRMMQTADLLLELEKFAKDLPFFVVGDFNDTPMSPPYLLMTEGKAECEGLKIESLYSIAQKIASAYRLYGGPDPQNKHTQGKLPEEPYTTVKTRQKNTVTRPIDYIFYSHKFAVCEMYEIPNRNMLPDLGLPSLDYGSDHLAIAAKLSFNF